MKSWDAIEQTDRFGGLKALIDRKIVPAFEAVPVEDMKDGAPKDVGFAMGSAFFGFIVLFMSTFLWLPDNWWGNTLRIICFFGFFFLSMGTALFLNRKKIGRYFGRTTERMNTRAEAMRLICDHIGLNFIAMPGGPPRGLMVLAGQKWAPPEFATFAEQAREMGGMDEAVAKALDAGLMRDNIVVIGTEKQKQKYLDAAQQDTLVEDGFSGERSGIHFDAFEWLESVDEGDDIYHLVIVLNAPIRLQGVTELRARKLSWLPEPNGVSLLSVDLGPKAFDGSYRLRASDQTEARALFNPLVIERVIALAHGDPFRAVARGDTLVFDIAGRNRFEIMEIKSGEWSGESIQQGVSDIAEMLELVDALRHAFMVRRGET